MKDHANLVKRQILSAMGKNKKKIFKYSSVGGKIYTRQRRINKTTRATQSQREIELKFFAASE